MNHQDKKLLREVFDLSLKIPDSQIKTITVNNGRPEIVRKEIEDNNAPSEGTDGGGLV